MGIVGNEASDADSIVSAIAYAWYLNKTQPETEHIAFVQCELTDLEDRLEFQEICKLAIVGIESLGRCESLHNSGTDISEWILVDHHFPSQLHASQHPSAFMVKEILDHHEVITDEAKKFVSSVKSVDIRTIGSTCTIVSERILTVLDVGEIPVHILWLLFLTIVIDTGNLSPELQKATRTDTEIYHRLRCILKVNDVEKIFSQLANAKLNPEFWYRASLERILKYDFKELNGIGYSVILRSMDGIDNQAIAEYAENRGFNVFIVSSGFFDEGSNSIRRQLFLYLPRFPGETVSRIVATVEKLVPARVVSKENAVARLEVLDLAFSRKKFFPLIIQILGFNKCVP